MEIVRRKTGLEPFTDDDGPTGDLLQGFMAWACSDLLGNAMRGLLAEYIVGLALGCVDEGARVEWDTADLLTREGVLVEVKSSAYLQSWDQKRPSSISFGIQPTRPYDAEARQYVGIPRRQAQVYVFCVFTHLERASANPLDLTQWDFYVASTARLDDVVPMQKTIKLGPLIGKVSPRRTRFDGLREAVNTAAAEAGGA